MIEANEDRPEDCCLEHWVNLQRLLQSEAKREQAARNVAMRAMVAIPRHVDRGGQVGVAGSIVGAFIHHI